MLQGTTEHIQTHTTKNRRCREKAIWGNYRAEETFEDRWSAEGEEKREPLFISKKEKEKQF